MRDFLQKKRADFTIGLIPARVTNFTLIKSISQMIENTDHSLCHWHIACPSDSSKHTTVVLVKFWRVGHKFPPLNISVNIQIKKAHGDFSPGACH